MTTLDERVAQMLLRSKLVRIRDLMATAFEHAAHALSKMSRGEDFKTPGATLHNLLGAIEDDLITLSRGLGEYAQQWAVRDELVMQANELTERALHLSNMDADLRRTLARPPRRTTKRSIH